ncbi:MAG TPA: hypothetical protein GXX14_13130 [Clostridiaceae bacterium]|nr:hypothetical protein [Clostridiaceae bacterium]
MVSKSLEKIVQLIPDENEMEFKNPMQLEYYLVESESPGDLQTYTDKVFGIEIVKKIGNNEVERKLIRNYSHSRQTTENILKVLAENTVTPVSLPYILDDIIGV